MPAAVDSGVAGLTDAVRRRWESIDRLLPAPDVTVNGCGAELTVTSADGQLVAAGWCQHWAGEPESLDVTWGAARRFDLTVRVAGPDIAGALDLLLAQWQTHLAGQPEAAGPDTAAVIHWPSRDVAGVAALVRRRFTPMAVIAARLTEPGPATTGAEPGPPPGTAEPRTAHGHAGASAPPGLRIRRADPGDLDVVVALGLDVIRFDAYFGGVLERPSTLTALRRDIDARLRNPQPWIWLAVLDGQPIGMLSAEPPAAAGWIAPMTNVTPVCYLDLAGVTDGSRGGGVGAALVARLHAEVAAARVPLTLLHYAQVNPLSAPFWSQQGYRPLWTCWEARPAAPIH